MHIEYERKFLVIEYPKDIKILKKQLIKQYYINQPKDKSVIRLRSYYENNVETYFIEIKIGKGKERGEWEKEITKTEFESFVKKLKPLEKTRLYVYHETLPIQLDIYHNELEGLMTAEVEVLDEKDKKIVDYFHPPKWMQREISDDDRYSNKNLYFKGMPKINIKDIWYSLTKK